MKTTLLFVILLLLHFNLVAQSVTITGGNQAKLNLPKLAYEQIQQISSPESGSVVYDLTTNCIRFFNGTKWLCTDQKSNDFTPNNLSAWKVSDTNTTNGFQSSQVAVDSQGNIYIAGNFGGSFQINNVIYTPVGYADVFVIKYNNVGVVQWVKTGGFLNINASSSDIVVDNQGNVYFAGLFYNQISIGGSTISANNGSGDVFLCKLSANNGNVLGLKAIGGSNYDTVSEMFIDNQNNLFFVGNFVGVCNFDGISITGIDNNDIFIAKCNNNLVFQWANKITGVNIDEGRGIYGDNNGNVFVVGSIASNATFAPGTNLSPGVRTMFIAKYDASNGNYIWHRNPTYTGSWSYSHRVVCDSEGNAYIGGYFFGNMNLGGMQFNASGSASDLVIAKISSNGDWQWYQQSVNSDGNSTEQFNDMKINANNELFVVCNSSFSSTFGFSNKTYAGSNFVFKFDKNGGVKGGNVIQGSTSNNHLQSIAFNGGFHYLTGYFTGSISFGSVTLSTSTVNGFVAKFVE